MQIPPFLQHEQTFEGGINSDLADELMPKNVSRVFFNCRAISSAGGNLGVVTNNLGNTLITTPLPTGFCKTHATYADEMKNKAYFAVYNSNGFHTWYVYDEVLNKISIVLQSKTDSNGIDILNFQLNYPILHVDIVRGNGQSVDNDLLYFCDAFNKGRKFNIQKAMDKSATGYGFTIFQDYVNAYKKCPVYAPVPAYFTDPSRNSNFLYAQLFKFCYRYIYDDGEISNYSDWSIVATPPNQSYQGVNSITTDNNCIALAINTGSPLVTKIEIAFLTGILKWQTCAILNKAEMNIADGTTYNFNFYNDGSYTVSDQDKINRPYSFSFRVPVCQAFVKRAMTYTGGKVGFPTVPVNLSVAISYQPLFIPPGTVNKLNSPSISVVQTSYATEVAFVAVDRYNPTIRFTIGADVKKGNVFTINGKNSEGHFLNTILNIFPSAGKDNYNFSYIATIADTALSVANQIKAYLRSIGRGIPDGGNGISGESVDGSGNAIFSYTYLGQWKENITTFTGSVTPVEFASLKDDGVSLRVIKSGSVRQYAVGYEDDDGRKSNAYTDINAAIRTPFITEALISNVLQQPVHNISLFSQPPIWARYWILYRTPDEIDFIQILIQQVIDVVVIGAADPGEYLDLVVGSLFTYQKIHPDVILAFDFERGDRLRLIKNTTTGQYYTPFFETEILSYNEVTEELVNAQIATHGTDHVEPSDGVRTSYVGKNISIEGIERTILSISGSSYVLDGVINIGPTLVDALVPNYTFIDRRGIIRIAKPANITIADFSTVELYSPQKTTDNLDFKIFNDTAQKFDISNYGTATRAHRGSHQDQDGTDAASLIATPAEVIVTEGDVYIRNREMPTNNEIVNTEVIVDVVEDPNFSDFYVSNLNNLGRVYPKDDGSGEKFLGSRTIFSSNYIEDTAVNGLNDFNDLDRQDNPDAFGDTSLTKFKGNKLHLFKKLRSAWIGVFQSIINTVKGQEIVGTSDQLLGPIQYYEFEGGIGDNPESWGENESYMYFASANSGNFLRLAGDGIDSISSEFGFDFQARQILDSVKKYKLRINFGYDKKNDEGTWSVPDYVAPVYNNPLIDSDWDTLDTAIPVGATVVIVTQPANGNVVYNNVSGNFEITMTADYVGTDTFTYKFSLPAGGFSAIKNGCINSVEPASNGVGYRIRSSAPKGCTLSSGVNDGFEVSTVLESYNLGDGTLSGLIMPNIAQISPDAIVPDGTAITYNINANVTPSGGANGDIWYNRLADLLFKKITGTWTILTNRVTNNFYVSPVQNLTDCPVTPPVSSVDLTVVGTPTGGGNYDITATITGILTNDLQIDITNQYRQAGMISVGRGGPITILAGDLSATNSYSAFDPSLGDVTEVDCQIITVTPNPNGGITVNF